MYLNAGIYQSFSFGGLRDCLVADLRFLFSSRRFFAPSETLVFFRFTGSASTAKIISRSFDRQSATLRPWSRNR